MRIIGTSTPGQSDIISVRSLKLLPPLSLGKKTRIIFFKAKTWFVPYKSIKKYPPPFLARDRGLKTIFITMILLLYTLLTLHIAPRVTCKDVVMVHVWGRRGEFWVYLVWILHDVDFSDRKLVERMWWLGVLCLFGKVLNARFWGKWMDWCPLWRRWTWSILRNIFTELDESWRSSAKLEKLLAHMLIKKPWELMTLMVEVQHRAN
jgi:hypothetical protein